MSEQVLAPVAGDVLPLSEAPDPVFAAEMVGSGVAIRPRGPREEAVAPISGKLVKVMPHAYVIAGANGGVLVHLGIDTVKLDGEGFDVLVTEGDEVAAGAPVVAWTPADIAARGLSELVLVCALDTPAGRVDAATVASPVAVGAQLFALPLDG